MMVDAVFLKISVSLVLILAISVGAEDSEPTRKLNTKFLCREGAEKCPEDMGNPQGSYFNLAYTTAVGKNDTLHYLISSHGGPAVVMAQTGVETTLDLNVPDFMSKDPEMIMRSLNFSEPPLYVSALMFPRMIEYNDTNDTADISQVPEDSMTFTDLSDVSVTWLNSSEFSNPENNVITLYNDASYEDQNASLTFKFEMFGNSSRNSELPHLEYNSDIMHMTVVMENLETSDKSSRFALEMILITTDPNNTRSKFIASRTLDDGHSPGVFKMVDLNVHGEGQGSGAFLQWKPIAYTGHVRNITVLTKSTHANLSAPQDTDNNRGLPLAVFGELLSDKQTLSIIGTNMSFGEPEDNWYGAYKYTLWTFSMGLGAPLQDHISLLIILIISIGLGIPVLMLFCGGIGVCVKRKRDNRPYSDITSSYNAIQ